MRCSPRSARGAAPAADEANRTGNAKTIHGEDRRARDLFERARYLMQQRTYEGYRKAIELLEHAIAIDPHFAKAHSHLGAAHGHFSGFITGATTPHIDRARAAARRALELDPADGEARAVLAALAHRFDGDWHAAEALYKEAIRLAPNSTFAHSSYAWGLCFHKRFDEAVQHVQMAAELDPLNLGLRVNKAFVHAYAARYEPAIAEFRGVLDLEPRHVMSHVQLGQTLLWMRDADGALEHFNAAIAIWPEHPAARLCRIAAIAQRGETDAARAALAAFMESDRGQRLFTLHARDGPCGARRPRRRDRQPRGSRAREGFRDRESRRGAPLRRLSRRPRLPRARAAARG